MEAPIREFAYQTLEALGVGTLLLDQQELVLYANPALLALGGHTKLVGFQLDDLLQAMPEVHGLHQWRSFNGESIAVEITQRKLPNGYQVLTINDAVTRYRQERLTRVLEQLARALQELKANNDLYRAIHRVLQSVMDARNFFVALCEHEPDTFSFPYMSDAYQEFHLENLYLPKSITAYLAHAPRAILMNRQEYEELIAQNVLQRYGTPHQSLIGSALRIGGQVIGVIALQSYDQHQYNTHDLQLLEAAADSIAMFIQAKRAETYSREAKFDALTGVYNRRSFEQHLDLFIRNSADPHFAVAFIDLDGFKPINDRYGHAAGDAVLQEVAKRLESHTRSGDVVARLGGDEFAIFFGHIKNTADVQQAGKRLIEEFKSPILLEQLQVQVGLSIGLAPFQGEKDVPTLLDRADSAMYQAKRAGGYRFVVG